MAHEDVFLVSELLEKNPGMTYTQAVKSLAQQEKLMSAAKTAVAKEAKAAPTVSTPEGGTMTEAGPEKSWVEKTFGITLPGMKKGTRIPGMFSMGTNPETGEPQSKVLDMLTAASPYLPSGMGSAAANFTGMGLKAGTKAAAKMFGKEVLRPGMILPFGAAAQEAATEQPSSTGTQVERGIGGAANAARELFGRRIPGIGPLTQVAGAQGLEQFGGNLARQAADKGPSNVDLPEALQSGVLGTLTGGLGGAYGVRAGAANATQRLEDTMSGPLKELNTYGTVKPFEEVKKALTGYIKGPPSKAGFDTAVLRQFRANPNNTIDGLLDRALGFKGKDTVAINSANSTLGKLVDLMAEQPAAQKEIKEKTGEFLITKFLDPVTSSKASFREALNEIEKGGNSALNKIMTPQEKQAFFSAIDNVKTIARTENLRDINIGVTGNGGFKVWLADTVYLLTPGHMATHILEQAKNPDARPVFSDLASYIRKLRDNPLTGGRLTRAGTEFIEKELLGIGAKPISVKKGMGPQQPTHPGFFTPPTP